VNVPRSASFTVQILEQAEAIQAIIREIKDVAAGSFALERLKEVQRNLERLAS